jgi:hypothetical protein
MTNAIHTHTEINCETGEVTVRPYTEEELDELNVRKAAADAAEAERVAAAEALAVLKASAKAKLAALGLTAEEIAAL